MALVDLNGPAIAPGESLSSPLDCRSGSVLRVSVPDNWRGTYLTFQIGGTADGPFADLFDNHGREHIVYVRAGATVLPNIQPPGAIASFAFIRFRSGSRHRAIPHRGDEPCIFVTTLDDGKGPAGSPGPTPEAPSVVDQPAITVGGTVAASCNVGDELACTQGTWTGEPTSYWQTWLADSAVVGSGGAYTVQEADAGKTLQCSVTATNATGSGNSLSNSITVNAARQA